MFNAWWLLLIVPVAMLAGAAMLAGVVWMIGLAVRGSD